MQRYNHIKATFFLGIFSMLLLHQIVPHLHHQHVDSYSYNTSVHTDDHSHHHDNPEKEDNSKSGFLDLFLGLHVHTTVLEDIPVIGEITKKLRVVDNVVCDIPAFYNSIILIDYKKVEKPPLYHPPNTYFNPYTTNLDTRGSPFLG